MITVTLKFVCMWHNLPLQNRCVNPNTLPKTILGLEKKRVKQVMEISNKNKIRTFLGWFTVQLQVNFPGSYIKKSSAYSRKSQAPRLKYSLVGLTIASF